MKGSRKTNISIFQEFIELIVNKNGVQDFYSQSRLKNKKPIKIFSTNT